MGAVSFSLDKRLVDALKSALPLNVLVETGTFKGDTVFSLESCFNKVVSIELSEALWADAAQRFADYSHVRILQGNSEDKLRGLRKELQDQGVLYWLDAHWCAATDTAGERSQCPLLEELQAIGKLNSESVVLIDDARLFLAPPLAPHEISQWTSFHTLVSCLLSMSTEHELMVVNDVIAFFPKHANAVMKSYAQSCGTDWLVAANCLKENGSFMQQLEDKEAVIKEKDRAILEKELAINELSKILDIYRAIFSIPILGVMLRLAKRMAIIFRPRLGRLNQYPAQPLVLDKSSTKFDALTPPTLKISIITPSYQQGSYIERTIQSVLDQSYPNLQYFVQDGGSRDSTVGVLKRYEDKLSGWTSEKDSGQSQAINLGFAHTDGEIMAWLNSDDLLLPGALTTVADYFNRHPKVDVVYGNRIIIDENDLQIGRWILPGHDSKVLSWVDFVPQETLFWRRRIWDKVGGQIEESFRFAMDWDLLVRFRDAGAKFAHIPRFLGAFRIHRNQKTSAVINDIGHQEMNRIRERLHGKLPSKKKIRAAILPFLIRHVVIDKIYGIKAKMGIKP